MNRKDWACIFQVVGRFAKENKLPVACIAISSVLRAVTPFITVILMGIVLDAVAAGEGMDKLAIYVLTALGINLLCGIVDSRARETYNQKFEYIKEIEGYTLNNKSLTMDYEYLEDIHVQELRAKGMRIGIGVVGRAIFHLDRLLTAGISILTALVIMIPLFFGTNQEEGGFAASWVSSVLLFVIMGFLVWLNYKRSIVYSKREKSIVDSMAGLDNKSRYYLDMFAKVETQKDLRNYGQQDIIEKDIASVVGRTKEGLQRIGRNYTHKEWMGQTVSDLSGLLVYLFTGLRAMMGLISIGQVVTYASSIIQFSTAVAAFAGAMGFLKQPALTCKDQIEYLNLSKRKYDGSIPIEKRTDNRFMVEFDHVSFKYPGSDNYVIKDLNLEFAIGERMAIVGKNGSGKTTFIKLLCRLYDVTEGCIKVNGIDIRKYDYQEYCRLFSVVFQDFRIFDFQIGENIAGRATLDKGRVMDALVRAGLGERMEGLPEGLDTFVGKEFSSKGVTFSGGEKQKMAIARAIYKDAPFVIMDEPTAALDPISECEVYVGFDKMVGNKTAIYISHRLASCRFCQDILVFDRGRVVQRGSHEMLEKEEGLYRELWNAQAQYYA